MREQIVFYLNGEREEVPAAEASVMLSEYLRRKRGLTGTKVVCAEGDCGACTVLRYFPLAKRERFLPINSCIATLGQLDGSSVVTIEALGEGTEPSLVQSAMVKANGSQCGFCTPGFVMALTGLVEKKLKREEKSAISAKEACNALTGNLCRCTGYQPILEAACAIPLRECESLEKKYLTKEIERALDTVVKSEVEGESFFAPKNLKDAVAYLKKEKSVRILGAATDVGVVHNKYRERITHYLSLHLISEMYEIKKTNGRLKIGARVTIAELRNFVKDSAPELANFLDLFASPQIKNMATIVGNVVNASPIADMPPALLVLNAEVEAWNGRGRRVIPLREFFLGYRKTALKPGEIVAYIHFDLPKAGEKLRLFKASQRKDLDISAVNAAFRVKYGKKDSVEEIAIAYGGVAATALRLKRTEKLLQGRTLGREEFSMARRELQKEITPISDLRGSAAFRRGLAEAFLKKFFDEAGRVDA